MVTIRLLYQSDKEIKYEYFSEGDEASAAGFIVIDLENEEIKLIQPAEKDYLITATVESLKKLRDSINEMRAEQGEELLTEEELPTVTEDIGFYCYASKAKEKITEEYNKGNILKDGCVIWY